MRNIRYDDDQCWNHHLDAAISNYLVIGEGRLHGYSVVKREGGREGGMGIDGDVDINNKSAYNSHIYRC